MINRVRFIEAATFWHVTDLTSQDRSDGRP
jgi:hypothetical protein